MKKTPNQIAQAIKARGPEANMASKYQSILIDEILAGGYSDPVEIEVIKSKESRLMLKYRLERLARLAELEQTT